MVRPATAAAVSASISTPVLSTVRTRASTVIVDRRVSSVKLTSTPVMRRGWQSGIRSGVLLAARMPAVRATPYTSPLASWPARAAASVAGFIATVTRATASRTVSALAETSTMRASPAGLRWERPRNPGIPRGKVMRRARRCSSDVLAGARVTDHGFHLVFRDELQLLQLAHAPLLIRGEEASVAEGGQLFVVLLVVVVELAELVAFGGEPLYHDIGVRHGNLPARSEDEASRLCASGRLSIGPRAPCQCVLPWGLPRFQSCRLQGCLCISA